MIPVSAVPLAFSAEERQAAGRLVELALAEDLGGLGLAGDLTSRALIPEEMQGTVNVVARADGILAGSPVARLVYERLDPAVLWNERLPDGSRVTGGTIVATVAGPLRSLLTGERTVLNFLMHLSGVATLTRKFVDAVAGTRAVILDTRKTLPGWRRLEKYAVRAGGGTNHRLGLADGCLIKDNHLAAWRAGTSPAESSRSIAAAVAAARRALPASVPVEVEVDTLEQLADALAGLPDAGLPDIGLPHAGLPDIVLLDNMDVATLRACVALRDRLAPNVLLEASGGIRLTEAQEEYEPPGLSRRSGGLNPPARLPDDVAARLPNDVAATGVDRISVGAITHSAPALDLAFDWP
jgi:nicotinate-nucleotide pyrophosphorylase (carboxylating)